MPAAATALRLPAEHDFGLRQSEREEPRNSDGGRLTLARKLDSVWEGLLAAGAAGCPVCGSRMERVAGAGSCDGCGSTLS
jgi:hypothetical protein